MAGINLDDSYIEEEVENLFNGKDREKFKEIKKRLKANKKTGIHPEKGMRYEQFDCQKYNFQLLAREEWGAQEPKFEDGWDKLMADVMITWTDTRRCDNVLDCSALLRELQRQHMDGGETDIRHNFMIADGVVFEGRGWHTKPPRLERWPDVADCCLDIAYIGPRGHFPKRLEQDTMFEFVDFASKNFCLEEKVGIGLDYFDVEQPMTDELQKHINTPPNERP